jgi:hypothetical protein
MSTNASFEQRGNCVTTLRTIPHAATHKLYVDEINAVGPVLVEREQGEGK